MSRREKRSRRSRPRRHRRRSDVQHSRCGRIASTFVEKGCWIKPFGDVIYLTPPLVIEPNDLSKLTHAIVDEVCAK